ncbi:MAG: pyridoxamine 5'-phosphate oxidase family protein [Actinomycetota bacterium]
MKAPPHSATDLAAVRRLFRDVPVAHVGTTGADGSPHVVPLWFVWLEDAVYVTCRRGSVVAANLERGGEVALAIDRGLRWTEHHGVLVRGQPELLAADHATARRALSAWFEKYSEHLSGPGFGVYTRDVEHPVIARIEAARVATWGAPLRP